jgi:hypothetical protein
MENLCCGDSASYSSVVLHTTGGLKNGARGMMCLLPQISVKKDVKHWLLHGICRYEKYHTYHGGDVAARKMNYTDMVSHLLTPATLIDFLLPVCKL